jgi:predicted ATPase
MKLTRIEITDFRGIDHLELDLTDPSGAPLDLVVLAGDNGCGKTAVLEAVLLALGQVEVLAQTTRLERSQTRIGAAGGFSIDVTASLSERDCYLMGVAKGNERFAFGIEQNQWLRTKFFNQRSWNVIGTWEAVARLGHFITYMPARRPVAWSGPLGPSLTTFGPAHEPDVVSRLGFFMQRLVDEKFGSMLDNTESKEIDRVAERIERAWQFLHGQEVKLDFMSDAESSADGVRKGFSVCLRYDGTAMPIECLSDGELELFLMVGWLALNDHAGGLVLIDEPEQHLHVQWQRFILRALRDVAPEAQFLVATHSQEVLDSVLNSQRFYLLPADDPRLRRPQPMLDEP